MGKIGLFFGSTTGNTEKVAHMIRTHLPGVEVHDVGRASALDLGRYNRLIFGASTWRLGELQEDWRRFLPALTRENLAGKTVALYGLGDQIAFGDTFVNGMAALFEKVKSCGARVVGYWSTEGYDFEKSSAVIGGHFVGLVLDDDSQPDLTESRLRRWIGQILVSFV